jgi:RimJ/RimL family protein N-acetyltransferase
MSDKYLFTSERLGFRNWLDSDIAKMIDISSDPDVMEFFPAIATKIQTVEFIERMKLMYIEKGYCYFAVDQLKDESFIGFIGLCYQTYESQFTPSVDIGWRLNKKCWNNGLATEGAKKCLDYTFNVIELESIISTTPIINTKSIRVMEKIGMQKLTEFKHPRLKSNEKLEWCICYEIINLN